MKEPEELQAQIDVLRQVVFSLAAQNPTNELVKDVARRLEVWEDLHMASEVSENYLNHFGAEKNRILHSLETLRDQRHAEMESLQPQQPAAQKKAAVKNS